MSACIWWTQQQWFRTFAQPRPYLNHKPEIDLQVHINKTANVSSSVTAFSNQVFYFPGRNFPEYHCTDTRKTLALKYHFQRVNQTRLLYCLNRDENAHNTIFSYVRDTADVSAAQRKFTALMLYESVWWLLSPTNIICILRTYHMQNTPTMILLRRLCHTSK